MHDSLYAGSFRVLSSFVSVFTPPFPLCHLEIYESIKYGGGYTVIYSGICFDWAACRLNAMKSGVDSSKMQLFIEPRLAAVK
jgi:hypothetical protein